MARRQKEWAIRARLKLLDLLGGKCVRCGTIEKLEFDCIIPQGHEHHRWETSARMSFYRRQHFEFQNLQILCQKHNAIKSIRDRKNPHLLVLVHATRPAPADTPF